MPLLPRRFERLKTVLNCRMTNLTVLLEEVGKPHNLSAILRTCDAVGLIDAHAISKGEKLHTFNSTAQGSQKWVRLHSHKDVEIGVNNLRNQGFKIFGTGFSENAIDYRKCDFTASTAFVLGAEKWGLSHQAKSLVDESIYIPMSGMVQSLNVSVAAATLLFEALRQRENAGLTPHDGEGLDKEEYKKVLFEWSYPELANWCRKEKRNYPALSDDGEILEDLPRTEKFRC